MTSSKQPEGGKRGSAHFRVAIVGAASLKGKEVKELLSERGFPVGDVRLLDDEEALGQLENVGDEPAFVQRVVPEQMEGIDFAFFAADPSFTEKTWEIARRAGCEIIDLSYGLESRPEVVIRAPWIEEELGGRPVELVTNPTVIAHPVSAVLALMLIRLQRRHPIRHVNATVFEPASEHGHRGMDELHDQTVNLLSFQQLPTIVYGTQVAFNVVPGYGEGAEPTMATIEQRVLKHYRAIVGGHAPEPSLMLLHAPVFHAHTFSIYVDLAQPASQGDFEEALTGDHLEILRSEQSQPSNLNASGQTQVQLLVRRDPQSATGFWIWAAADNLRVSATLAVETAEDMAATRPRGQVQ